MSCLLNQMAKWGLFYLQYWTKDIGLQVNTSISQKNKIKQKKLGVFENEIQYYFHFVLSNAVILSIGCIWINCITSLQRATVYCLYSEQLYDVSTASNCITSLQRATVWRLYSEQLYDVSTASNCITSLQRATVWRLWPAINCMTSLQRATV